MRDPNCKKCYLGQQDHVITRCVWGHGNLKSKLVLIGEAPGENEDKGGMPFIGRAGDLLNECLSLSKINRPDIYITNPLKCRPKDNKLPPDDILKVCSKECRPYLDEELKQINPMYIILLGSTPLKLLTGYSPITPYVNKKVGYKIYATWHPSYILRNLELKKDLVYLFSLIRDKIEKGEEDVEILTF